MRWNEAVLVGLRLLVVIVAMGVVGMEVWALQTINDIESRGTVMLETVQLEPADKENTWRDYFDAVTQSELIIWIAIATCGFSLLTSLIVLLSVKIQQMKIPAFIMVPLEFLSMSSMATGFAFSLSLAVNLARFGGTALDADTSSDLATFSTLPPRILGHSIAAGLGTILLSITTLSSLVSCLRSRHQQKACSFEPTASSLGIDHGYSVAPVLRDNIPTIYDPEKPMPESIDRESFLSTSSSWPLRKENEESLAGAGARMGRRDSQLSERSVEGSVRSFGESETGSEISGPLGLEKPQTVHQMRPARPWSEAPKRYG